MSQDYRYANAPPTPLGMSLVREGVDLWAHPMDESGQLDSNFAPFVLPKIPATMIAFATGVGRSRWVSESRTTLIWMAFDLGTQLWQWMVPTQVGGEGFVRQVNSTATVGQHAGQWRVAGSIIVGVDIEHSEEVDDALPPNDGIHLVLGDAITEWGSLGFYERVAGRCHVTAMDWILHDDYGDHLHQLRSQFLNEVP